VSPRDLAILPILLGSIATGSRFDTPPRQAPSRFRFRSSARMTRWRRPGRATQHSRTIRFRP